MEITRKVFLSGIYMFTSEMIFVVLQKSDQNTPTIFQCVNTYESKILHCLQPSERGIAEK